MQGGPKLLELMPRLRQAIAHLQAMDGRAEDAIADAERRKWTARYSEKGDRAADGGRTVEQEVARRVARTLDDPYRYVDNVGAVDYDLETLSGWLRQASLSGKALFLVYKEY